jgi:hypothetical protein
MKAMATSITALPLPQHEAGVSTVRKADARRIAQPQARRHIDPQSGHALEILGHAIEYLTDEYVHAGGSLCAHNAQVEAIQMLMAANRAVYFACAPVPSLGERLRRWLGLTPHQA